MSNHYAEPKYNAAFDRCIDVMVNMIQKYGPSLIDQWNHAESSPDESSRERQIVQTDAQRRDIAA